ncbi:MAG: hypothetical protein ACFFEK_11345 [Candidatus Thorarchaeota archaeon]
MEYSSNIETLATRLAPIVHFHPEEGEFCCFPSDAEKIYAEFRDNWDLFIEDRSPKKLLPKSPCYYEYWEDERLLQIRYWFWYRFNDFQPAPFNIGKHVGDWEHVEVRLYGSRSLEDAIWLLSNHYEARLVSLSKTLQGFPHEEAILKMNRSMSGQHWGLMQIIHRPTVTLGVTYDSFVTRLRTVEQFGIRKRI